MERKTAERSSQRPGESENDGGSALEGKAGAVWEINASVKRGEVVMAGVRSISHTHPRTDSADQASERSCVCASLCLETQRNIFIALNGDLYYVSFTNQLISEASLNFRKNKISTK